MKDVFVNRLDMFTRSLGVLDRPEHKALWDSKPPLVFTTKVGEARAMTGALQDAQKRQETDTTGAASEKDREETELEEAALLLSSALTLYYRDAKQETEAAEMDLTATEWRRLRDQPLLAKSQAVIDHATAVSTRAAAAKAAEYGITPAAVQALTKERKDYADIVNAPDVVVAIRKALTQGFRPAFRLTEAKFDELDRLIGQYGSTPKGKEMIAAWKSARVTGGTGKAAAAAPAKPAEGNPSP